MEVGLFSIWPIMKVVELDLFPKSLAYILQEEGYDTVEANNALGFPDDIRSYEEAIQVLNALREKPVTLITNNPKKIMRLSLMD